MNPEREHKIGADLSAETIAPPQEAEAPLSAAELAADYRESCQRPPHPKCDDRAALQCKKVNERIGSERGPASVCLFRGDGRSDDKTGDHNSVGE